MTQDSDNPLYRVAINCPHEITAERIILHFDPRQPGHNALNQLHRRLEAATNPPHSTRDGL